MDGDPWKIDSHRWRSIENWFSSMEIHGKSNLIDGDPWKIDSHRWRSMENQFSSMEIQGKSILIDGDPWKIDSHRWRSMENQSHRWRSMENRFSSMGIHGSSTRDQERKFPTKVCKNRWPWFINYWKFFEKNVGNSDLKRTIKNAKSHYNGTKVIDIGRKTAERSFRSDYRIKTQE